MHIVYKIHKIHARVYREKQAGIPHVFSVEAVITLFGYLPAYILCIHKQLNVF